MADLSRTHDVGPPIGCRDFGVAEFRPNDTIIANSAVNTVPIFEADNRLPFRRATMLKRLIEMVCLSACRLFLDASY